MYFRRVYLCAAAAALLTACGGSAPPEATTVADAPPAADMIHLERAANAIHAVIEADRTAYSRFIVNRLDNEEGVIKATEHWQDEKTLLLPAQMFRAGAEIAREKNSDFSYSLLSEWAINKKNLPQTDAEKEGLAQVVASGENFYGRETLGGIDYYVAVYPDKAVALACVNCHNNHVDSPKTDFAMGDVMGGVVVRLALGP